MDFLVRIANVVRKPTFYILHVASVFERIVAVAVFHITHKEKPYIH